MIVIHHHIYHFVIYLSQKILQNGRVNLTASVQYHLVFNKNAFESLKLCGRGLLKLYLLKNMCMFVFPQNDFVP